MSVENRYLLEILTLSQRMLEVAHKGTEVRTDTESGIVFGTLHDYAMHLRKLSLEQIKRHRQMGWFDEDDEKALDFYRGTL